MKGHDLEAGLGGAGTARGPEPPRRTISVTVVEATGLSPAVPSALCNAYVSVCLVDAGSELTGEVKQTKSRPRTNDPTWNEEFVLGETFRLTDVMTIRVKVFHKDGGAFLPPEPLGRVEIPVSEISPNGSVLEKTVDLQPTSGARAPKGKLRLLFKYRQLPMPRALPKQEKAEAEEGADKVGPLLMPPNQLIITLRRCEGLKAMNKSLFGKDLGTSDPFVRFEVHHWHVESEVKPGTLNPVWLNDKGEEGQVFVIPAEGDNAGLVASVFDKETLGPPRMIGQVKIPLERYKFVKTPLAQRFDLKNQQGIHEGGKIVLVLEWVYDEDSGKKGALKHLAGIGKQLKHIKHKVADTLHIRHASEDTDEDEDDEERSPEEEARDKEEAAALEKAAKEQAEADKAAKEELLKELNDYSIESGDYQVQVHVIECRDLIAKDVNGLSDPVVSIEVFGQKQYTSVHKRTLSCVFDEVFLFNQRGMDREDFEAAMFKITVMDADMGVRYDSLGSYSFDATYVYFRKDHEVHRTWVALMDDNGRDSGVTGYLKLSISVLGPKDKPKIHDPEEEERKEREVGNDKTLCLMPPSVKRYTQYLVITLYRMEHLPIMDRSFGKLKESGVDPYMVVQFGTMKPFKSKVLSITGDRSFLNCNFDQEIWIPVNLPTVTRRLSYRVFDQDTSGPHEEIAEVLRDVSGIVKAGSHSGTKWLNMYGPSQPKTAIPLPIGGIPRTVDGSITGMTWRDYYMRHPDAAPMFRGRLLVSERMEMHAPKKYKLRAKDHQPFRRTIPTRYPRAEQVKRPASILYYARARIYLGSGIPKLQRTPGVGEPSKMRVSLTFGKHEERNHPPIPNHNGLCAFISATSQGWIDINDMEYPEDQSQMPDLIITLLRGSTDCEPVSFCRIPAAELLSAKFDPTPRWVKLFPDRVMGLVEETKSPGYLLMSLGMGNRREWARAEPEWRLRYESFKALSERPTPYELRLHVYMGRDLPSSDADGLVDPYLKMRFADQKVTSDTVRKNVNPVWMRSFGFETTISDFNYAPLVVVEVWDYDVPPFQDEKLGVCFFSPNDFPPVLQTLKSGDSPPPTPRPKWFPLLKEEKGRYVKAGGELLIGAQLVPKEGGAVLKPSIADLNDKHKWGSGNVGLLSIETRPTWVEVTALGVRDMKPFQFRPMSSPFVTFAVQSPDGTKTVSTDPCKKPNPSNANYNQRLLLKVDLPVDEVFAPQLTITAKDVRFGGIQKPIVGVCNIDLRDRIPWYKGYTPPKDMVIAQHNDLVKAVQDAKEEREREEDEKERKKQEEAKAAEEREKNQPTINEGGQEFALRAPDDEIDPSVLDVKPSEDSGAGVFGALLHVKDAELRRINAVEDEEEWARMEAVAANKAVDDEDNEPIEERAYMKGRKILAGQLEDEYPIGLFQTFTLFLGKAHSRKPTGRFKGLIRVIEREDEPPLIDMDKLTKPTYVKVRLYVLRGLNIAAMDPPNLLTGEPGRSDPYLILKLGKTVINERKNYAEDRSDVDIFRVFEFDAAIPGDPLLEISMMDYDLFGGDDLIGKTLIDLEDRFFDETWQKWGMEHLNKDTSLGTLRLPTKPVERRSLYCPSSANPMATLECWVDMLLPQEASLFLPDDVALPPAAMFEVRVVIWKTKDVVSFDSVTNMNDLFVRVKLEGCDLQLDTDTHWRSKKGKGSFNYRLKFPIELGPRSRAFKFPHLSLQMWDRDIVKWNDCIAEAVLNLGKAYRLAYKKNQVVTMFQAKKRKSKTASVKTAASGSNKSEPSVEKKVEVPKTTPPPQAPSTTKGEGVQMDHMLQEQTNPLVAPSGEGIEMTSVSVDANKIRGDPTAAAMTGAGETATPPIAASQDQSSQPEQDEGMRKRRGWCFKKKDEEDEEEEEKEPLMSAQSQEDEENQDLREFIATVKEASGLYDMDPPDSTWIHMDRLNPITQQRDPMGSVCISIQVWPIDKAQAQPVGSGRNQPNHSPFLPPPVGRLKFSFNPFVLGAELLGPGLCAKLTCCIICLGMMALLIFCQPAFNIIIALIFRV